MVHEESPDPDPSRPDTGADLGLETEALRRVARQLLRDQADQDDLIQDTWLAYLEAGEGAYRDASSWRKGVLKKKALRLWDKRRRHEAAALVEHGTIAPPASDELERTSVREMLRNAIEELKPAEAEVLGARFFDELSLKEIAARIGSPLGTVKARLSRGLARLRAQLDARTGDPRLTGIALITAFEWRREDALPAGAGFGLGANAVFALVLATFATLAAVLFGIFGVDWRGETPEKLADSDPVAKPEAELVAPPNEDNRSPDASVGAEVVDEGEAATAEVSHATGAVEEVREPTVTVVGYDAAGVPLPGFTVGIWNGYGPTIHWKGPAGSDGRVEIPITEELVWAPPAGVPVGTEGQAAETPRDRIRLMPLAAEAAHGDAIYVPCPESGNRDIVVRFDQPRLELSGRVVDPDGRPIGGATVYSGGETQIGAWDGDVYRVDEAWNRPTGSDGTFYMGNEKAGRNFIEAKAPGYSRGTWMFETTGQTKLDVTLTLVPALEVVGVVRDRDGHPVPGAQVYAEIEEFYSRDWAVTGADGSYRLNRLPPGTRRMWARAAEVEPGSRELDSTQIVGRAGERVVWDPVLETAEGICIEVVDADDRPVSGQSILFRVQNDFGRYWLEQRVTGPDGRCTVYRDPGGPVLALFYGGSLEEGAGVDPIPFKTVRDLRPRHEPYRVQLLEEDVTFGSVRGRVLGHDGNPIEASKLTIVPRSVGLYQDLPSSEGSFHVDKFPAGDYILRLESQRGGAWSRRFHLEPGEDLDLGEMRTPPPGTLRVENEWPSRAEGLAYRCVVAIQLEGFDGPDWVFDARTEAKLEGEFTVLPGKFVLTVRHGDKGVQQVVAVVESGEATVAKLGPKVD